MRRCTIRLRRIRFASENEEESDVVLKPISSEKVEHMLNMTLESELTIPCVEFRDTTEEVNAEFPEAVPVTMSNAILDGILQIVPQNCLNNLCKTSRINVPENNRLEAVAETTTDMEYTTSSGADITAVEKLNYENGIQSNNVQDPQSSLRDSTFTIEDALCVLLETFPKTLPNATSSPETVPGTNRLDGSLNIVPQICSKTFCESTLKIVPENNSLETELITETSVDMEYSLTPEAERRSIHRKSNEELTYEIGIQSNAQILQLTQAATSLDDINAEIRKKATTPMSTSNQDVQLWMQPNTKLNSDALSVIEEESMMLPLLTSSTPDNDITGKRNELLQNINEKTEISRSMRQELVIDQPSKTRSCKRRLSLRENTLHTKNDGIRWHALSASDNLDGHLTSTSRRTVQNLPSAHDMNEIITTCGCFRISCLDAKGHGLERKVVKKCKLVDLTQKKIFKQRMKKQKVEKKGKYAELSAGQLKYNKISKKVNRYKKYVKNRKNDNKGLKDNEKLKIIQVALAFIQRVISNNNNVGKIKNKIRQLSEVVQSKIKKTNKKRYSQIQKLKPSKKVNNPVKRLEIRTVPQWTSAGAFDVYEVFPAKYCRNVLKVNHK